MNIRRLVTRQDLFRTKEAGRRAAAAATFEEKVAKLVQLQKMNFELAQQDGRPAKKPWDIQLQT